MKLLALTLCSIALTVSAQTKPACSDKPEPSGFTGCETLVLENVSLKMQPYQQKLQELAQEANTLITNVVAAHPGMKYEPSNQQTSQQFPYGRIVAVPAPAPAPAAPAAPTPAPTPAAQPNK